MAVTTPKQLLGRPGLVRHQLLEVASVAAFVAASIVEASVAAEAASVEVTVAMVVAAASAMEAHRMLRPDHATGVASGAVEEEVAASAVTMIVVAVVTPTSSHFRRVEEAAIGTVTAIETAITAAARSGRTKAVGMKTRASVVATELPGTR